MQDCNHSNKYVFNNLLFSHKRFSKLITSLTKNDFWNLFI